MDGRCRAISQPNDACSELASITLSEQSLDTVMATIDRLTKQTTPGASEVSVTLIERGRPRRSPRRVSWPLIWTSGSTGVGSGRAWTASCEPILLDDLAGDHRWHDWGIEAAQRGAGSSLSIPVPVQRDVGAARNVYGTDAAAFDPDMQLRALIEQAKGILMGQRRCDAEAAFDILLTLSQHTNRKLCEVAQALVDQSTDQPSDG